MFAWNRYVPVVISCLVITFSSCSGAKQSANGRLPFGVVDVPHTGEVVHETVPVGGWALSDAGIKEVNLYVDRTYAITAQVGFERPDVAKAYPSIGKNERSGWNATLNTKIYASGPHEVTVQAKDNNGVTRDLGSIIINIAKP